MLTKIKNAHTLKSRRNSRQKVKVYEMSERRLTNTIYIMVLATRGYRKKHNLSVKEFLDFDNEHNILNYLAECPDSFDDLPEEEMAEEIDELIS